MSFISSRKWLFSFFAGIFTLVIGKIWVEVTENITLSKQIQDLTYIKKFFLYEILGIYTAELLSALFLLILISWVSIEFFIGFKSLKLLYRYYVLSYDSFPGISAVKKVIKCLILGGYKFNWVAARIIIEYQIWDSDELTEKNAILDYIDTISNQSKNNSDKHYNVKNCFNLTDSAKQFLIENYFEAVDKINNKDTYKDRFLTHASIETGYVAPQHLLDGLLSRCNESWPSLIENYDRKVKNGIEENERVHLFTFFCWLLWGPSIPIGHCQQWEDVGAQTNVALQYGFGDENNSLPVFPLINGDRDDKCYRDYVRYILKSPFAQPAPYLKVRPVWISRDTDKHQPELKRSLGLIGDAQKSIFGDPLLKTFEAKGKLVLDYIEAPNFDSSSEPSSPNKYYSSYIWVMFIVCDGSGKPVYGRDKSPWFGMIPYFEHANISDDSIYSTLKRQLANKALTSISELSGNNKLNKTNYIYHYACASDDSNCTDENCMSKHSKTFKSSIKIRDYLENLLGHSVVWKYKDGNKLYEKEKDRFSFLNDIVRMPSYEDNWKYKREFSSCHLPEIINDFYTDIL